MIKYWFHFALVVAAAAEIASQVFGFSMLHIVAKPLLLIFLAAYYWQSVPSVNKTFFSALAFCWAGDVFLLLDHLHAIYFMAGLGSFLIAHVLFIFVYRQLRLEGEVLSGPQRARFSFPAILASSGLVTVLYPVLGDLKIPVMVYTLVLTLMVVQSIFRFGRTSSKSFWLVFFGAASFMVSDALLSINKFHPPLSNAGVLVMGTYIAAVYMIVQGVIAHSED